MNVLVLLHPDGPLTPRELWGAWSWQAGMVVPLALSGALYAAGTHSLWRSAGRGRGVRPGETAAFVLGWLALAVALTSPLHRLGEVLFSAHMAQHEILMAVAAPLLVLGRPLVPFVWSLPPAWRRGAGSWTSRRTFRFGWGTVTHSATTWTLHAVAIWVWHLPSLYQATLESGLVHVLQHASFLGTGLLFWWSVLRRRGDRIGTPLAVVSLFTTALHTSLLGALLAFSSRVWYPLYGPQSAAWGLTPLEDQQLAGLIMWVPAGIVYAAAALALLATWLVEPRARGVRFQRLAAPLLVLFTVGLAGCERGGSLSAQQASQLTGGGDVERGAAALRRFGCGACHVVPGVPGAEGQVGPPLAGIGGRAYIAGVLTNTPDHMIRWIVDPRRVDSLTAMPTLGVSEPEARDMAAYLYSRRGK
ncbi:MAG TPA: cytochrome c oxidase assembly protein [Gemmatimonadales bacterium]|nr:cytochrome c oxidase assembly protein [Gemmatimonadales bacterium]